MALSPSRIPGLLSLSNPRPNTGERKAPPQSLAPDGAGDRGAPAGPKVRGGRCTCRSCRGHLLPRAHRTWGPAAAAPEADPEPRPHLAHQPLPVALGPIAVHVPSGLRGPAARPPPFSSSGSCRRCHPSPAQPREGPAPPSLRAAASRGRPRRCLHVSLRGGRGGGAGPQPLPYSGSGPAPTEAPRGPRATSWVS